MTQFWPGVVAVCLLAGGSLSLRASAADWVELPPVARIASVRPIPSSELPEPILPGNIAAQPGAEEVTAPRPVYELPGKPPLADEPFEIVDPPVPSAAERFAMVPPQDNFLSTLSPRAQQCYGDGTEPYDDPSRWQVFRYRLGQDARCGWQRVKCDYRNYYSWEGLGYMVVGFSLGAAIANTNADERIQEWYQDDVRTDLSNDFSRWAKLFGEGQYVLAAGATGWLVGEVFYERPVPGAIGEWGGRTLRSLAVGVPPMLLMQYVTGASRPVEEDGSRWHPFEDNNGVSGHAFMGATPFINAAKMSERWHWKAAFYACSVAPAWSRVNDNSHYTSQAILGWWMAYWAATAVDLTNREGPSHWSVVNMSMENGNGVGLMYTY